MGTEDTRVFREVSQLGQELEQLGDMTLGSVNEAEVGIVFDWDNYWALEYTSGPTVDLTYVDRIHQYYKYFYDRNIPVNMIPFDGDLDRYKIIVAPVLYMVKEGMREALENFVRKGGVLVTTYMSGIVDQSDNVYLGGYPGVLSDMAGVWVEEIDALAPEQENTVIFHDGESVPGRLVCDIIHLKGAECIGRYGKDFYAESPAVTRNRFGDGHVLHRHWNGLPGNCKVLDMAAEDGCETGCGGRDRA
ncbi:MAG: beta-galactosidase trimerization domain-containing protein [Blautia marasmi]